MRSEYQIRIIKIILSTGNLKGKRQLSLKNWEDLVRIECGFEFPLLKSQVLRSVKITPFTIPSVPREIPLLIQTASKAALHPSLHEHAKFFSVPLTSRKHQCKSCVSDEQPKSKYTHLLALKWSIRLYTTNTTPHVHAVDYAPWACCWLRPLCVLLIRPHVRVVLKMR